MTRAPGRPPTTLAFVLAGIVAIASTAAAQPAGSAAADPFAHYIPGACAAAKSRADQAYFRAGPDSVRRAWGTDTLPAPAREAARRCVARHDLAKVLPRDLVWLAEAMLAAGDDAGAERAIARRLATEERASSSVRALTLANVVSAYLAARPVRVGPARAYLARVDALADSGAVIGRIAAHGAMLRYLVQSLDDSAATREAELIIQLAKRLDGHDREEFRWSVFGAYNAMMQIEADRGGAPAAHALIARARADIGKLSNMMEYLASSDSAYARIGRRAPPIAASRWVGGEGAATVRTRPGRLTLVVFHPDRSSMPALRRLAAAFASSTDLVMSTSLSGHFRGEGPLAPAAELDSLARYFGEELRAPGAVALEGSEVARRADGRVPRKPTPTQVAYGVPAYVSAAVVDREGVIRYVLRSRSELHLEKLLRRLE